MHVKMLAYGFTTTHGIVRKDFGWIPKGVKWVNIGVLEHHIPPSALEVVNIAPSSHITAFGRSGSSLQLDVHEFVRSISADPTTSGGHGHVIILVYVRNEEQCFVTRWCNTIYFPPNYFRRSRSRNNPCHARNEEQCFVRDGVTLYISRPTTSGGHGHEII